MKEYSTGKTARELHVLQVHLRALCQAGVIAARSTKGGHWRIPKSEVDRLKREGLPELPALPPEQPDVFPSQTAVNRRLHSTLLAEPSKAAIAAADEVVLLENEVRATRLRRAKTEDLDWFRERQQREESIKRAQQRNQEELRTAQEREQWLDRWLEFGLKSVPHDAPRETQLDVHQTVGETLAKLASDQPNNVVQRLVVAAVEKGLKPWRRKKEIEEATIEARNQLPYSARGQVAATDWDLKAMRAASQTIRDLGDRATSEEIRAAALQAGRQVAKEYEHRALCQTFAASVSLRHTPGAIEKAREAVKAALGRLPIGANCVEMSRVRDQVLAPFRAADDAAGVEAKAAANAEFYLVHVDSYLEKLALDSRRKSSVGDFFERRKLAQELKAEIRPILVEDFLEEPLGLNEAYKLVESLVDERI